MSEDEQWRQLFDKDKERLPLRQTDEDGVVTRFGHILKDNPMVIELDSPTQERGSVIIFRVIEGKTVLESLDEKGWLF
jgi:hypothetical protein